MKPFQDAEKKVTDERVRLQDKIKSVQILYDLTCQSIEMMKEELESKKDHRV